MKEITAFTADGDFLAVLSTVKTVKIWNTSNGSLLAEWKPEDGEFDSNFSCLACSFVGKKRKKERGTCLVALATDDGHVFVVDVSSGDTKWKNTDSFPGGVLGVYFTNKGRNLHVVGANRKVYNMDSETGDLVGEFKASKKSITALAISSDEKFLAVADGKLRVLSLECCKEVLNITGDLGQVERASISDDANTVVTVGPGDKHLQVWNLDIDADTSSRGPSLSMKHAPLSFDCKNGSSGESGTAVLAVSKSGAYVWHLRAQSDEEEEEVSPTRITCKAVKEDAKKSRVSIVAARLQDLDSSNRIRALIAYGSIDQPRFSLVDVSNPGEDVEITDTDINGLEATASPKKSKKENKKRAASDLDQPTLEDLVDTDNEEADGGVLVDDSLDEPTMGDRLADLNLVGSEAVMNNESNIADLNLVDSEAAMNNESNIADLNLVGSEAVMNNESNIDAKPPSADSVHILLKQALNADDRVLLLDCLYTQDEKVIAKSISQLSPSHVLKLLQSLMSITQSRGAILACALPWLKSLLLQHSSGIMSQQSSMAALNSLYQLIESRVSTFQSALQLSSVLDVLYTGIVDEEDESGAVAPVIFEDKDSSEEEESEDEDEVMETDDENDEAALGGLSDLEGLEGSDGMMSE